MKAVEIVRKKVNAYVAVFQSPDGQAVLADLQTQFGGTTLRKADGVIDVHASLAAAGCREVVLYIEAMMRMKTDAVD
jgi:mannose/fructose-specific phosphotransferase system component IIA